MQPKTYHIKTFGCQANISDSERIAGLLENFGVKYAETEEQSDILIFNSCSVRQSAEDRVFGLNKKLKKIKEKNPRLITILTGCMTHYNEKILKNRLPYIDIILPIKNLAKLPEILNLTAVKLPAADISEYISFSPKYESKFKGYIPISSGCDNFCSYCIVPYSRGREASRHPHEIISEAENLAKRNYKEIWLLGQNVNGWQHNFKIQKSKFKITSQNLKFSKNKNYIKFADLLKMVNDIPGNFWLRFTSPHPKDFSDDLIKAMAECEKFAHYLNLPVQSGDNEILKKMNRNYGQDYYMKLVQKIKKAIPDICLSTDTIVGFPGETEKQFMNTVKLYKDIGFDTAYISEYSARPNTLAAKKFKDNISKSEKERRKKYLTKILAKTALNNNKLLIGKTLDILIDEEKKGALFGRTAGNKTVKILTKNTNPKIGEFVKIKIASASPWRLSGEKT